LSIEHLNSDGRPALIIETKHGRSAYVLPNGSNTWHSMNLADAMRVQQ
jgi:hypothetical protein